MKCDLSKYYVFCLRLSQGKSNDLRLINLASIGTSSFVHSPLDTYYSP